ncbi:hypothetical protein C2S53_009835 [Perilla frutescens var. hirtella]|uniref:GDSL esterase/lipase n=1 Tax=Perilla frutescens var. hirtella TaxID=608512 RepID=A0AAD4JI15_PERFH|nr:hypothetical protein C2S53_009835 [Perilla frutescens var. hirtella]
MEAADAGKYTAMYIFGDSLIDNGNNINFPDSIAKANFLPYGIDFATGPTGRFCNGKIIVDFIAELLGLPLIPSYADTSANILYGVNYASAGAGILADTGHNFGRVIPLGEQISNFKKTVAQLRERMEEEEMMRNYLGNALVFMNVGANDYLNNYLNLKSGYTSGLIYTPQEFADLLIKLYRQHILEIQGLGLRKFLIAEASPIGCAPIEITSNGECNSSANNMVKMFNLRLKPLVQSLKTEFLGSAFMLAPSFQVFTHLRDNAEAYGFKVKDEPCCGASENGGTNTKPRCYRTEMIGLPLIPSYADMSADTQYGVNYASAGAGILADTGHYFGRVIPLSEQISNFKKTVAGLRKRAQEKEVSMHLGNALVFVDMGTNDYLNNYLKPGLYPSGLIYTSREFADLLTEQFRQQILEIQGLGLRHFLIAEASPIGCVPVEVSNGECNSSANNMVEMFNLRLEPLVRSLESEFPGSAFAVAPSFQVFTHVYDNAEAYGFKVKDQGCCGRSANGGTKPLCLRNSVPCPNRDEYLFWDFAHPTEAANRVLARLIYNATQLP